MRKLLIITFFFLSGCLSDSNFDPLIDDKVLKEICSELPTPLKTSKLDERAITKSHAGVFSIYYSHESTCVSIENHYNKVLKELDWKIVQKSLINYSDDTKYRKGELEIGISCSDKGDYSGTKRYSVACSKG